MIRVLVIEDEADLLDDIVFGLRHEGFEVSGLADGCTVDALLEERTFDVLILDLGLPGEDGTSIARRLHQTRPGLGIIMLTGRSSSRDRVLGLESGADMYLTKTADRRELAAAVRAVARRVAMLPEQKSAWILNRHELSLCLEGGRKISLTRQETLLLAVFARNYGGEASRRQLIEGLGENYFDFDQRRLETLVSRLRRKISAEAGVEGESIRSLRGEGYLFTRALRES